MIQRYPTERIAVWWWDAEEDWAKQLAQYTHWPVPVETDNSEVWDGGGA